MTVRSLTTQTLIAAATAIAATAVIGISTAHPTEASSTRTPVLTALTIHEPVMPMWENPTPCECGGEGGGVGEGSVGDDDPADGGTSSSGDEGAGGHDPADPNIKSDGRTHMETRGCGTAGAQCSVTPSADKHRKPKH